MGGMTTPKGGKTTTTTDVQTVPPYVQAAQQNMLNLGQSALSPHIQPGEYTQAPLNADTIASYDLTRNLAGQAFSSQPTAPAFDTAAYMAANPDVAAEATKKGYDPAQYAQYHYDTYGKSENRNHPMTAEVAAKNPIPQLSTQKLGDIAAPTLGNLSGMAGPNLIDYRNSNDWKANATASTYNPASMEASTVNGADITALLNPYTKDVVDTTNTIARREYQKTLASQGAAAAASGYQGGSRAAVADAILGSKFNDTAAATTAQLMSQGYDKATATALANAQSKQSAAANNQAATNQAGQFNAGAQNTRDAFNATQGANMLSGYNSNALNLYQQQLGAKSTDNQNALSLYKSAMDARNTDNTTGLAQAKAQEDLKSGDFTRQQQAIALLNSIGAAQTKTYQDSLDTPLKYLQAMAALTPTNYGGTDTKTAPNTAASPLQSLLGLGLTFAGKGIGK